MLSTPWRRRFPARQRTAPVCQASTATGLHASNVLSITSAAGGGRMPPSACPTLPLLYRAQARMHAPVLPDTKEQGTPSACYVRLIRGAGVELPTHALRIASLRWGPLAPRTVHARTATSCICRPTSGGSSRGTACGVRETRIARYAKLKILYLTCPPCTPLTHDRVSHSFCFSSDFCSVHDFPHFFISCFWPDCSANTLSAWAFHKR